MEVAGFLHGVGHEEFKVFLLASVGLGKVLGLHRHFKECRKVFLLAGGAVSYEIISSDEGVHPLDCESKI